MVPFLNDKTKMAATLVNFMYIFYLYIKWPRLITIQKSNMGKPSHSLSKIWSSKIFSIFQMAATFEKTFKYRNIQNTSRDWQLNTNHTYSR